MNLIKSGRYSRLHPLFSVVLPFLVFLTVAADLSAQMSGSYTVGTGNDFGSLPEAVDSLTSRGVSGPVTMLIDPCADLDCGPNGQCILYGSEARCLCDSGYADWGSGCEPRVGGNGICSWDEDAVSCPGDCVTNTEYINNGSESLEVFPNPANGKVTLSCRSGNIRAPLS